MNDIRAMRAIQVIAALAPFGLSVWSAIPAAAATTNHCHIGSYRLSDGRAVDIAPSDRDTLRWRMFTGETGQLRPQKDGTWANTYGWTNRADGKIVSFSDCAEGRITFEKEPGRRIAFDVRDTTFDSERSQAGRQAGATERQRKDTHSCAGARFRA